MITHHPSPELLLDYAAGAAREGVALIVATHATLCRTCRAQLQELDALGGFLLEDVPAVSVDEALLDATLARLDESAPLVPALPAVDDATRQTIPQPLRRYVGRSLGDLPWRSVGRKFQEARLPLTGSGIKASLMRLRPGSLMPQHTHRGNEYTLVLAGGYRDAEGAYGPGDFDAKDAADLHQPVVDDDGECLCLVVLDAPVKLTGAVGRLVNPFLRI